MIFFVSVYEVFFKRNVSVARQKNLVTKKGP